MLEGGSGRVLAWPSSPTRDVLEWDVVNFEADSHLFNNLYVLV